MKSISLRDWLPILGVRDGCILSKRGDLTFGWRVSPPVIYTVDEDGYDSILRSVSQAVKLLPMYCIVHKQDVFRYDVCGTRSSRHFLRESYYRHFASRKFLNNYSYIYVTFSNRGNVESGNGGTTLVSGASGKAPDGARVRACAHLADQFEAVLMSNPLLSVERL